MRPIAIIPPYRGQRSGLTHSRPARSGLWRPGMGVAPGTRESAASVHVATLNGPQMAKANLNRLYMNTSAYAASPSRWNGMIHQVHRAFHP
jgi:hypothetical protein